MSAQAAAVLPCTTDRRQLSTLDGWDPPEIVRCPNRPTRDLVGTTTGLMLPAGRYSQRCPVCVQTVARRYAAAIGMARPDQHLLLTDVGDTWPEIRARVNYLRRDLKRRGYELQDAYHVEPFASGLGCHVHMWVWGPSRLASDDARAAALRAGMGRETHVSDRRSPAGAPLAYGLKMVLEGPPGPELREAARLYLTLNGGRLVHPTRGFWRDGSGAPIRGARLAQKQARASHATEEWVPYTDGRLGWA